MVWVGHLAFVFPSIQHLPFLSSLSFGVLNRVSFPARWTRSSTILRAFPASPVAAASYVRSSRFAHRSDSSSCLTDRLVPSSLNLAPSISESSEMYFHW